MNKINNGAVEASAASSSSLSILPSTSNEVGERALGNNTIDANIRPPPIILPSDAPLLPGPLNNSFSISRETITNNITSSISGVGSGVRGGVIIANHEKTIPFLRQLTQMLRNNTELISFIPGKLSSTTNTSVVLGQIVVHDRRRVQNEVLPIYFNHSSFASLRRQLSYFSFVRVGKGRQQAGVIYTNENVVELEDICKLRRTRSGIARRASGGSGSAPTVVVGGGVAEPDGSGVGSEWAGEDEIEQGLGGENFLDGISVDHIAFPRKVVASGDQVLPPGRVNDSNDDDDRVASAMMSGALHAASDNCHSNKRAILATPSAATAGNNNSSSSSSRTTATAIHSSFLHPIALTSSSPSSNAVNNNSSRNSGVSNSSRETTITNINCNLGNKLSIKNNNNNSQRHFCSRVAVPMKDGTRFDRLLSINSIVPFIHLPAPASTAKSSLMKSALFTTSAAKGVVKEEKGGVIKVKRNAMKNLGIDSRNDDYIRESSPPKKSKVASSAAPITNRRGTRERSSSDCVVTALLALGADRQ